jgi:hypothetical protein
MKRRLPRDPEKEAREQATLLKAWKAFHAEELEQAFGSAHGAIIAELMGVLDQLEIDSAATLLDFMQRADWRSVDYATRLTALHQVNQSIARLRARNGLPEIDDPLPGQPDNAFRRIKALLFPNSPASPAPEFVATDRTARDA